MLRRRNCDKRHDKWGRDERRLMRWSGVKDEDDMIRKRNVGKEMRKERI
jgi:hypothetical protein